MKKINVPPQYDRHLDSASNGLGAFCCLVLAAIIAVWLCSAGIAPMADQLQSALPDIHLVKQQGNDSNYYKRDGIDDQGGFNLLKKLGII